VNFAIEALSESGRRHPREIEGRAEEIAELMNCPIGTVRSRIFRSKAMTVGLLDTRERALVTVDERRPGFAGVGN
jgi:hypothetical protein